MYFVLLIIQNTFKNFGDIYKIQEKYNLNKKKAKNYPLCLRVKNKNKLLNRLRQGSNYFNRFNFKVITYSFILKRYFLDLKGYLKEEKDNKNKK